ncbi:MAG: integrase core domain-containing protein, partial [Actinobacteria bacterium]|nr:integrase core domain-containing protein [Actinomycetota bacterium]
MQRACRVLDLDERRERRWEARRSEGRLADRPGGGNPVHALTPTEVEAILALHAEWAETDGSHRKLAHRGSYLGRVWVSPATVFRVLAAYGRVLPHRPRPEPRTKTPWPEWVSYRPNMVWGYDLTAFPAARCQVLAILDLLSRKWIAHLICSEASSTQVQVLFTRALEAEGLLDQATARIDGLADPAKPRADQPILLAVSDNGAQMTSGSTREFMALHAIATHFGRPGVPTDQAPIESFLGHLKTESPQLAAITEPAALARELEAIRGHYNSVRLHAGVGYVTPDDEHQGRGPAIRNARRE